MISVAPVLHVAKRLTQAPIHLYRYGISPFIGPVCRYQPTCSAYALEAVTVHGSVRGSWLAVRRLGRCHPWTPGGYDPVPPPSRRSLRRPQGA